MTVKGAISAFRSACFEHDAAKAHPLQPRGADVLLGHHLGHRGAGHPRDVAHAVDRDGEDGQREVVERRPVVRRRGRRAREPLQPDHLAGEDHGQHDSRDVFRRRCRADRDGREHPVLGRALAHAGEDPEQQRPRHHHHHHPEHQDRGQPEPRPEHLGDRRVEPGRVPEVAARHVAEPLAVAHQERPVEAVLVEPDLDLLLGDPAAGLLLGELDEVRLEVDEAEHDQRQAERGQHHHADASDQEDEHPGLRGSAPRRRAPGRNAGQGLRP